MFIFLILGLILGIFLYNKSQISWSAFVTNGKIVSDIVRWRSTLVFGTNYSKLYFLDFNNPKKLATLDLNTGQPTPRQIKGGNVLVTSDDTLRLVNINTQKVLWQKNTENQIFFQFARIYGNYVLAGSTDGKLVALRLRDGKEIWRFASGPLESMNSVLVSGNLKYFGNLDVIGNRIYLASQDKSLYSLNLKNGKVIWKQDLNDTVSAGPATYHGVSFLGTKSGSSYGINNKDGNVIWKSQSTSPVVCLNVRQSWEEDFGHDNIFSLIGRLPAPDNSPPVSYYELHENGELIKRDAANGKVVWSYQNSSEIHTCPTFWKSEILVTGKDGNLSVLSASNGKKVFEKLNVGNIIYPATINPRLSGSLEFLLGAVDTRFIMRTGNGELFLMKGLGKLVTASVPHGRYQEKLTRILNIFSPGIIIHNTNGNLWLLNVYTGKAIWDFSANAPTENALSVVKNRILFVAMGGVMYKLNLFDGAPVISSGERRFRVTKDIRKVGGADIFELSLKSDGNFTNPWVEADISAVFTNKDGESVYMPGFYYDENIWKIRFNAPKKGLWKWKIYWKPHGSVLTTEGEYTSDTDTSEFYLRSNNVNPKRLSADGKTIFNGLGLGDTVLDYNYNGTPLDDWAVADSASITVTNSSGFTSFYKSDLISDFDKYIATYGPNGAGFNIFRWSLANASQPIYMNLGYPTTYSVLQGKIGDDLAETLRNNGIHVWLTLFGFDVPFKDSGSKTDQHILKAYIKYMYARYGAYADIWEVANEIAIRKDVAHLIKEELSLLDGEKRLISISSDSYNFEDSDVIAPHWYETEKLSESDAKTWGNIVQYNNIKKPVVFTEQGNLGYNFDATSGVRMRVRTWAAFLEEGILMFWNQSDTKEFTEGIFPANIYLGPEERKYTSVLQKLTGGFPLEAKKTEYRLEKFGVRGYGMLSDTKNIMYFFHTASPFTYTRISTVVFTENGGAVNWVDPANGAAVQGGHCSPGYCTITSPSFKTDMVLTINSQ